LIIVPAGGCHAAGSLTKALLVRAPSTRAMAFVMIIDSDEEVADAICVEIDFKWGLQVTGHPIAEFSQIQIDSGDPFDVIANDRAAVKQIILNASRSRAADKN
jgi:hypothetical protein